MWTLARNFWFLEVKAETERSRGEVDLESVIWRKRRKREGRKQKVLCEGNTPYCSDTLLFCQPRCIRFCSRLISYGARMGSVVPDITSSLQLHTNTGIQESTKSALNYPLSPVGGKNLQKPHILSSYIDHVPTFKSIGKYSEDGHG